jgi:hypothetical protein
LGCTSASTKIAGGGGGQISVDFTVCLGTSRECEVKAGQDQASFHLQQQDQGTINLDWHARLFHSPVLSKVNIISALCVSAPATRPDLWDCQARAVLEERFRLPLAQEELEYNILGIS